MTDIML